MKAKALLILVLLFAVPALAQPAGQGGLPAIDGPTRAAIVDTRAESMPPLVKTPIGTSAVICFSTAVLSSDRSSGRADSIRTAAGSKAPGSQ